MIKVEPVMMERTIDPGGIKPRVLILAENMGSGGMERQIIELLKGLKSRGRFSTVMAVFEQGGTREAEARAFADIYLSLPRRSRFDVSPAAALVRTVKPLEIRLIHTYGWISGMAGLAAAKLMRVPIINGGFREAPAHLGLREKVNRWCALRSQVMVSNTYAGLASYGLANHPRARVIYNGMDFTRFPAVSAPASGRKTICMVANFGPHKDHKTLIDAFGQVKQQVPDCRLVMVGHDIGTLAEVQQHVLALGLNDAVDFETHCLHPEPIVAQSDIGVLASLYGEGISNALLEYMFLGKPVIATNAGGNPELIQEGLTGMLVAMQSPEALAKAILYLLSHPEQAHTMGEAGRQYVQAHFSLDRMISDYEALYASLLSA